MQVIPGGIGDILTQLFSFNYPGCSAGFTLHIPLSNGSARADYDRALNEREVSAKRKAATAQRIVIEVRNAYTQLEMNRSRITTARTAREFAARRLDAEQKKFELGTSTVRFVFEVQRNVAQAETNEIQALVNYTKTLVAYDRAIRNTLARNNIALDRQLPKQLTFELKTIGWSVNTFQWKSTGGIVVRPCQTRSAGKEHGSYTDRESTEQISKRYLQAEVKNTGIPGAQAFGKCVCWTRTGDAMTYVFGFLKEQPFALVFLVISAGFLLARAKFFAICFGVVAWTLIFGALLSLLAIFSDYARAAIRLSALMEIPVIHIFTHDSIGVGEDGQRGE